MPPPQQSLAKPPNSDGWLAAWELSATTGNHFGLLDGLRGVAILLVVAHHAAYTNPSGGFAARAANWVIQAGWMGVPIFFVLSGFLIALPFFKGRESNPLFWYPHGYARRRLGKIIPPFYLSIVFFLAFYWWQYRDPAYFNSAWKWASGLGNFLPITPNFNGVYWSLIVEAHFYIVLPLLFGLTRRLSVHSTTLLLSTVLIVVPPIIRQWTWPAGFHVLPPWDDPTQGPIWLTLHRFPCELGYFGWGVAFAGIFVQLDKLRDRLSPLSSFGYLGILLLVFTISLWGYWSEKFAIRGTPTHWSFEIGQLLPSLATMLMLFFLFDRAASPHVASTHPGCVSSAWSASSGSSSTVRSSTIFGNTARRRMAVCSPTRGASSSP